jgi:hypothetical protein
VGCREEFLTKEISVVLWLFLFKGGDVLKAGRVSSWDLPQVNCLTLVSLGLGAASQFLVCLELLCKVSSMVFLPCWLCFEGVFVPRPREVTEAFRNACGAAAVATGLTGAVHRSDWCHRSDRRKPSV